MGVNESQKELLEETDWDWILMLDAARYDYFEAAHADYLHGDLSQADNGGIGFTETWFRTMFPKYYDAWCFNPQPIYSFEGGEGYDERDHFAKVPSWGRYPWKEDLATCPPSAVNDVVRESEVFPHERGMIRYLQPHPPFRQMVEETKGRGNRHRTLAAAVARGDIDLEDVHEAYRDNLEWGLEAVADLVSDLEGSVVVTADHGEFLGEDGNWFHSGALGEEEIMRTVPWLETKGGR